MLAGKKRQNWFFGSFPEVRNGPELALNNKHERRLLR
tara:strand:+ start:241 stop:351 length:111 start_codon:yes stop_codon:yes gene_type:complete